MRFIKILYILYTIPTYFLLFLKSLELRKRWLFCGFPSISCGKNSVMKIGENCRFMSLSTGNRVGLSHRCILTTADDAVLMIGNKCSFSGVSIRCFERITLGNNVRVGANCLIIDGDAHQDDPRSGKNRPIVIENNVWLGANVVVKKGVRIGRNSVIGMNSVVNKDIPANCIAIGNPCVVIKFFDDNKIKEIEEYYK